MPKPCSLVLRGLAASLVLAGPGVVVAADLSIAEECSTMFAWITAERVRFHPDSADLRQSSYNVLYRLAEFSGDCPGYAIAIIGHTDSAGDPDYNQALSERRARAVAEILTGLGVPEDRLTARGAGAAEPLEDNDTAWGRERNRRIEFRLEPPG